MESGIVTSYKNKGIIIPELISWPFFLRSSNSCLKNCFSDKFSLRAFIFPHAITHAANDIKRIFLIVE